MTSSVAINLAAEQQTLLEHLADEIMPSTETMPSASEVNALEQHLDRVLSTSPKLAEEVRLAVTTAASLSGTSADRMAQLVRGNLDLARALVTAVAASYYLSREVKQRLGYAGQEGEVIDRYEMPEYMTDGSLQRVVTRWPPQVDPDGAERR